MKPSKFENLREQIRKTISALEAKLGASPEPIVSAFLLQYQNALKELTTSDPQSIGKEKGSGA